MVVPEDTKMFFTFEATLEEEPIHTLQKKDSEEKVVTMSFMVKELENLWQNVSRDVYDFPDNLLDSSQEEENLELLET